MNNSKAYIIVLNYNGWKDTIECLESVLKNDYLNYQIIVVDNASTNNSMQHIIKWANGSLLPSCDNSVLENLVIPFNTKPIDYDFYTDKQLSDSKTSSSKKLIFIQSSRNGGFAAGNNLAIQYIQTQNDYSYIWLLNNDTVIKNDALSELVKYAEKNKTGITGSSLYYYHNPERIQAYGGHVNKFFGTSSHILDAKSIEDDLNYIVGASFLIKKEVIDKIGLLPEEYFLYYEETDYCFNARKNGFKLGVSLESVVYHKEGGSTGAREKSEFSDILSLKNRIKFHRKYLGGGFFLWLGMLFSFINRIKRGQLVRIYSIFR